MRSLIATALVFCCGICSAEDLSENANEIKALTAEEAAYLVATFEGEFLFLNGVTSIDKDTAQELAKVEGGLSLGLTSIDKDVAQELAKFKGILHLPLTSIDKDVAKELAKSRAWVLTLSSLTSVDKDVAQELAKFNGWLTLNGLTSIDKDVLPILKSNPKISFPQKKN